MGVLKNRPGLSPIKSEPIRLPSENSKNFVSSYFFRKKTRLFLDFDSKIKMGLHITTNILNIDFTNLSRV